MMKTMLLALLVATPAFAAPATKAKAPVTEDTSFAVDVPRSELALPPLEREDESAGEKRWSIGASTWAPDSFSRGTYNGGSSTLKRGSLPYFFGEVGAPLWRPGGVVSAVFGLGYGVLERSGPAAAGGLQASPTQELRLIQLRLGAEYESAGLGGTLFFPYAGIAALPTFGMASKSQFEERVSVFGLAGEGTAGVRLRPNFLREFWSFRNGTLGLAAHYVFGTMDGSSLRGLGAQGYLQVSL